MPDEPIVSTPPDPVEGPVDGPPPPLPSPRPDPPKPYPGFWQAIGLFALYTLFQVLFIIPFGVSDYFWPRNLSKHPALYGVVVLASGALVIRFARRRLSVPLRQIAGPLVPPLIFFWTAGIVFGLLLSEMPVLLWISRRFPSLIPQSNLGLENSLWGAVLLAVIAAPLIEETIFRGIFLRGFIPRYGTMWGIVAGAALFGAAHLSLLRLVPTVSLGLLLGWLYSRTRSIWPGVLGHAVNNSFAALAVFAKPPSSGTRDLGHFTWAEPAFVLVGAGLMVYGISSLRLIFAEFDMESANKASAIMEDQHEQIQDREP